MFLDDDFRVKVGLAEMLKGGVIMDVTNAEQAKIAEDAGAAAVMALERVPADIRKEGGVARMAPINKIREIMAAVSIPVMAKARIGHFMEARVLEALEVDYIDESEVLTPGRRGTPHRQARLQGAVRLRRAQPGRGPAAHRRRRGHDPHQGRGRLRQHRRSGAPHPDHRQGDETDSPCSARKSWCPSRRSSARRSSWSSTSHEHGRLPVPNFSAGGIATPADAALVMQLGAEAVFVGSGIFKSDDPETAPARSSRRPRTSTIRRSCSRRARNSAWACRASTSRRWSRQRCCKPAAGRRSGAPLPRVPARTRALGTMRAVTEGSGLCNPRRDGKLLGRT